MRSPEASHSRNKVSERSQIANKFDTLSKCAHDTADGHDVGLLSVRRIAVMPVMLRVLRKVKNPNGHQAELSSAW